jgi:hypothetical protein
MANVKISELRPVGYELFQDAENFLNELSDREMENIEGAHKTIHTTSIQTNTIKTYPTKTNPILTLPIDPII